FVEGAFAERKASGIAAGEMAARFHPILGAAEHLHGVVEAEGDAAAGGDGADPFAGPAAEVEDPFLRPDPEALHRGALQSPKGPANRGVTVEPAPGVEEAAVLVELAHGRSVYPCMSAWNFGFCRSGSQSLSPAASLRKKGPSAPIASARNLRASAPLPCTALVQPLL